MKIEDFKYFSDGRGDLLPIEFGTIPFIPRRCFIIDDVAVGTRRGGHMHKECLQYLICINGMICIDYTQVQIESRRTYGRQYLGKGQGIFINKMTWIDLTFKEYDSRLLVLCSHPYDLADYITEMP